MDVRVKKNDIVLIMMAILVSGIALWFCGKKTAGTEVVISSPKEEKRYNVSVNQVISLDEKGHNVIEIKNGKVMMVEADCRDQICVKHRPIDKNGETIICLPNDVYVTIKGDDKKTIDN